MPKLNQNETFKSVVTPSEQKMRLTQKKIEDISLPILGEEGMALINELFGKENISEFDLANRTKKDIKIIRRLLYNLYNHNLVCFTRKKDKQKGWYIYYWTLIPESFRYLYHKNRKRLLERLKNQLEEENKELFFVCPNTCVRLNFDQSMDFEFHCPECGELITQDQNEKRLSNLKSRIKELEKELVELEKEKEVRKRISVKKVAKVKKTPTKKKTTKKEVIKKKPTKKKTTKKKKIPQKKPAAKKKKVVKKTLKKKTVKKKTNKKNK